MENLVKEMVEAGVSFKAAQDEFRKLFITELLKKHNNIGSAIKESGLSYVTFHKYAGIEKKKADEVACDNSL